MRLAYGALKEDITFLSDKDVGCDTFVRTDDISVGTQ